MLEKSEVSRYVLDTEPPTYMSTGLVDSDPETLATYVSELYSSQEKMVQTEPDIESYVVTRIDASTREILQVNKLPWPLKYRATTYTQQIFRSEDQNNIVILMYSNDKPVPHNTVRTNLVVSGYMFVRSGHQTLVYRVVQLCPGGMIPTRLVNKYSQKTSTVIQILQFRYWEKLKNKDHPESIKIIPE